MPIIIQSLAEDPELYLHAFGEGHAHILQMPRAAFERSIFLDGRIDHGDRRTYRVPLDALLERCPEQDPTTRPVCWIFHVAQCGSTLLARALDLPGRSLVLREPMALRQLGVMAGAAAGRAEMAASERFGQLLRFTLSMLGKRWEADRPVIVKANVPVNFIAGEVMALAPETPAITLHFALEDYLAAVLRTDGHQRWVESVFAELGLAGHPMVADVPPASTATRAAALWFAQVKAFEALAWGYANVYSLDAGQFFAEPAPVIEAAAALFGVELAPGEASEIAASELFQSYSKNPALEYDPEVRPARAALTRRQLSAEIAEAVAWARAARERHGLCEALPRPLTGTPTALLP